MLEQLIGLCVLVATLCRGCRISSRDRLPACQNHSTLAGLCRQAGCLSHFFDSLARTWQRRLGWFIGAGLFVGALVLPSEAIAQTKLTPRPAEARQFGPGQVLPDRAAPLQAPEIQPVGGVNVDQMLSPSGLSPTLKIMILMTLLSLVPSILIMTTSFIRFVVVFGLLRQALGTQNLPPNQVITALALFMTMFVMTPIWQESYEQGIRPYIDNQPIPHLERGEEPLKRVFLNSFQPLQRYMSEQIHKAGGEDVVFMLIDFRRPEPGSLAAQEWKDPESFDEVDPAIIVTAFMLSELKTAFVIGFQIYLPFLVIDMVTSMLLTAMGMMMLPPSLISLPFKLLLFVLIDGWTLTVHMLLRSVEPGSG